MLNESSYVLNPDVWVWKWHLRENEAGSTAWGSFVCMYVCIVSSNVNLHDVSKTHKKQDAQKPDVLLTYCEHQTCLCSVCCESYQNIQSLNLIKNNIFY